MLVVFNPVAGRRRASSLWRVLDLLVENGVRVEVAETQHAGHATALARAAARAGAAMVVAAGGDGTIAEVANGLIGSNAALGVIPLGTANVVAQEYGISTLPREIAAALAYKRSKTLWPGVASGPGGARLFVQMLGVGFDGAVVHGMRPWLKRALGRGAYVLQSLATSLTYGFPRLSLAVDGTSYEAASVIVTKGRLYGGPYLVAPEARSTAPGFQVVLFERPGMLASLFTGAALPLGQLPRCPGVRILGGSRVEFLLRNATSPAEGLGAARTQTDGDALPFAPSLIADAANSIQIVTG